METATILLYTLGFLIFYFIPGIVAENRHHKSAGGVWVVNIFTGWTFIGWVVALAWACSKRD